MNIYYINRERCAEGRAAAEALAAGTPAFDPNARCGHHERREHHECGHNCRGQ